MRKNSIRVALSLFLMLAIVISTSFPVSAGSGYHLYINYQENVVTLFDDDVPVKAFLCSTGSATPHSGTYYTSTTYRWALLKGGVWGQFCTIITGSIWFHSVPYCSRNNDDLEWWEYDKLGTTCSAGCVRLAVEDAEWLYDNLSWGTPVTFYASDDPGPLGKPLGIKIGKAPNDYCCWDPTDDEPENPWRYNDEYTKKTFDPDYYLEHNPELKNKVRNTPLALKVDWINTGIDSERRASEEFDLKFYKNYYSGDSVISGKDNYDLCSYYNSWNNTGAPIGSPDNQTFKLVFDSKYYADSNPDLKSKYGYDSVKLWNHYINYGVNQNRQGSRIFSLDYYKKNNPELKLVCGDNPYKYMKHFIEQGMSSGLRGSENFDVKSYKMQYPDLRNAYGDDLAKYYWHYNFYGYNENRDGTGCTDVIGATTKYNGADYSKVYDYYYYIDKYPEVKEKYGNDDIATLKHFIDYGMAEGQQAIDSFDVMSYKRQYPDLRNAYGDNLAKYYWHYRVQGCDEGRNGSGCDELVGGVTKYNGFDYSKVYDYDYYVSHYPSVKSKFGDDDIATLKYFVETGMSKGQQAISSFDVMSYKRQYPDLRNTFGDNLAKYYWHYSIQGYFEGRAGSGCDRVVGATSVYDGVNYSLVYNYDYYIDHYPDVKAEYGLDDVSTLKYFVEHGMAEGHQACASFDVMSYKRQYPDLRNAFGDDLTKYYWHYRIQGHKEFRCGIGCNTVVGATTVYNGTNYAKVYDYNYYIDHYPDVKAEYGMDDVATLKYFVEHGMAEGHQACANFDVMSYKRQYPDLRNAFGDDLTKYYWHYRIQGCFEGRNGTGCTELVGATTVYDGVNYAKVYDFNYYMDNYPDLKALYGDDDIGALAYFVEYGMAAGHQAISTFDVESYRLQYPDLRKAFGDDITRYYWHYRIQGYFEGRDGTGCTEIVGATTLYNGTDYSKVYDYYFYTANYPDVKAQFGNDDAATLEYFVENGMAEGQQGIESFEVNSYRADNPDLDTQYGDDLKQYYIYYMNQ